MANPPSTASQPQWLRKASLIVANAAGDGLDLSNMQFRFKVCSPIGQTPQRLEVRIFNLAPETAKSIQDEGIQVQLKAGYQHDPYGVIFAGLVTQIHLGRENGVDSYLDLVCQDGDFGINFAVVNQSLKAGWTQQDHLKAISSEMVKKGITIGDVTDTLSTARMPRGKVLYGPARDYMRSLANSAGCQWHVDYGKMHLLSPNEVTSDPLVVLTPQTGLLDQPEQTIDGVTFRCLLQPNIKYGCMVQIDTSLINQVSTPIPVLPSDLLPGLDANGTYKVYAVEHYGDTRGNEWYTEAYCASLVPTNGVGLKSDKFRQARPGNF